MNFAKGLDPKKRIQTLTGLIDHMDVVWNALTETDDLVMIQDLRHINDMKKLLDAIEEFRKIMS